MLLTSISCVFLIAHQQTFPIGGHNESTTRREPLLLFKRKKHTTKRNERGNKTTN